MSPIPRRHDRPSDPKSAVARMEARLDELEIINASDNLILTRLDERLTRIEHTLTAIDSRLERAGAYGEHAGRM
jgi:hypothetical protein